MSPRIGPRAPAEVPLENPLRRYKRREGLTYPQLARRLGTSEILLRKLGSRNPPMLSIRMALRFEARSGGGIPYLDLMVWMRDLWRSEVLYEEGLR